MKKLLAILLALIMMLTTVSAMAAAAPEKWDISKSKTATNLDANYESKVTLSLPSAEEPLVSDIVFVLDKSTSAQLEQQALDMLGKLKVHVEETGATVKVGVVIFNKVANVANDGKFFNLATEYDGIEAAIKQEVKSGTNTHAGLLAGKKMLDDDKSVENNRKYLIFVSDGITYMYDKEAKIVPYYWMNDNSPYFSKDPYSWQFKYLNNNAPDDWSVWIKVVEAAMSAEEGNAPDPVPYDSTLNVEIGTLVSAEMKYTTSVDRALYYSYQTYQAAKNAGYNVYAMTADSGADTTYPWGPSFMNYLAGDKKVDFSEIRNDILYLVGAGSTVTDTMGYVEGDYNFDFVNDAAALSLKVGDDSYQAIKLEDNKYGFKPSGNNSDGNNSYDYIVEYFPKEKDEENFVWTINVPVSNFAPVQLTYAVKLTNPKTASGTYGTYDKDGSKNYEGLYTNNSAVLIPKNSSGDTGADETFNKPTVSYTVSGGGGGHTHYDPTPSVPVVVVVPPKTGDMPLWYGIARFLGLVK